MRLFLRDRPPERVPGQRCLMPISVPERRRRGQLMAAFRLGPVVVEERIASGGTGNAWQGVHVEQGVPIALEVIRAQGALDASFRLVFRREVSARCGRNRATSRGNQLG
jgi:hypothetical protein